MANKLTSRHFLARFNAFNEAADHLMHNWTDDPLEQEQKHIVSEEIRNLAYKALDKAQKALRREEAAEAAKRKFESR